MPAADEAAVSRRASDLASGKDSYVLAMIVLAALGLAAAIRLPRGARPGASIEPAVDRAGYAAR